MSRVVQWWLAATIRLLPPRRRDLGEPGDDDFLACGFVHIGVWGRRPP